MHITALHDAETTRELAVLQVVASFAMELALGCSPDETLQVEVVGELVAEFQKLEEWHSLLERPDKRIYDLLLGPPPSRAGLADHLDDTARKLGAE
jgi:hypothetical protein